jgi:acyl-CoA thioesterase FadM
MTAGSSGPFREYRTRVRPEWVDYNGHMNDAAYSAVLSEANEVLLDALGLSADYRQRTGAGLFTVESHVRYLEECTLDQELTAASVLVAADTKRLHVSTELLDAAGRPMATGEHLYLHVDAGAGRVTAMPADRQQQVDALLAAHADLPRPEHLGRGVGARRPSSAPSPAEQAVTS